MNRYLEEYDVHEELRIVDKYFQKNFPIRAHLIKESEKRRKNDGSHGRPQYHGIFEEFFK